MMPEHGREAQANGSSLLRECLQAGLVSVVIPTRNRMVYLPDALASVQRQTYTDLEILVIDDGSTDGTSEFLLHEAAKDSRIQLLRTPGLGAPAARNRGILVSRGEFIAFQDDDTQWAPEKIERLLGAIREAGPEAGFVYSPYESHELDGSRTTVGYDFADDKYRGPWRVGTCAVMVRKDVLERSGRFDETLPRIQDVDLWIRVLAETKYVFVPELLARTQRVEGGISTNQEALKHAAAAISAKYRGNPRLSRQDRAMVHYILGHRLLLQNDWRSGIAQLLLAVATKPTLFVGWGSLAAAALGPYPFRLATRLRVELARRRSSKSQIEAPE